MTELQVTTVNLEGFLSELAKVQRGIKKASFMAMQEAIQLTQMVYQNNLARMLKHNQPAVMKANWGAKGPGAYVPRPWRLQDMIGSKAWNFRDGTGVAGFVGAKSGKGRVAHLVEFGTRYRLRLRIGGKYAIVEFWISQGMLFRHEQDRRTGIMPAYHILQLSVDQSISSVADLLKARLHRYLTTVAT